MSSAFDNFNLGNFWEDSEYARKEYIESAFSDLDIKSIENELGYKLPSSYIALMRPQNGGIPKHTNHPTSEPTSWAKDHVAISGIYAIGRKKANSLCGSFGSNFWVTEWDYPNIGIYFADCPSAGHDMLCLDYRKCGPRGEPEVVHVDQERKYKITFVANNFEEFIRGLVDETYFEET